MHMCFKVATHKMHMWFILKLVTHNMPMWFKLVTHNILVTESWLWNHGLGILVVEAWLWNPVC